MARALLILANDTIRAKAIHWIKHLPEGTRVEFKGPKRTLPQNDLFWSLLTEVATQKTHGGSKYSPDQWKVIFLHAIGREVQFIPALDGKGFIPWGQSSSDLSKSEMTDLIEFIYSWGAENGVQFKEFGDTKSTRVAEGRPVPRVTTDRAVTYQERENEN